MLKKITVPLFLVFAAMAVIAIQSANGELVKRDEEFSSSKDKEPANSDESSIEDSKARFGATKQYLERLLSSLREKKDDYYMSHQPSQDLLTLLAELEDDESESDYDRRKKFRYNKRFRANYRKRENKRFRANY